MTDLPLSEGQLDALRGDGFLAARQLFAPPEVGEVRSLLAPLFERFAGLPAASVLDLGSAEHALGEDVPEILYPTVLEPRLRRTAVFRCSARLARQVLGPRARFRFDHSILKPPHCEYETVWHQDRVHKRSRLPEHRLNVWVPMAEVGADDGCMRYLPGSHRLGLLPHRPVPERRGALRTVGVDEARVVDAPLPVGGAALHFFQTVHGAHANDSDRPRLAWILQFTRPWTGVPLATWAHQALMTTRSRRWRREHDHSAGGDAT